MADAAVRPRNRRGHGAQLRAEILQAAADVLVESGVDGVTLRAIARRAGITAPSIYAHFAGLDAVLEALVASTFELLTARMNRAARRHTKPVQKLHAVCRSYVDFANRHPHEYSILFIDKNKLIDENPDLTVETMTGAAAFAIVPDIIEECVAAGASTSQDATGDAVAIWVALHGFISLHAALPQFPWPAPRSFLDSVVDRLAFVS